MLDPAARDTDHLHANELPGRQAGPEAGLDIANAPTRTVLDCLTDFAVEDHVGYLLRRAHQRHVALFTAAVTHAELTPTQFTALLKTAQERRVTQNHLGRLAAMDPATIQGVAQRLMARGLIRRGRDPMDRRMAVLEPTEAGVALITSVVSCAQRAHDAALAPLSPEERIQVLALLRKMG
jgi:MarR family transcriptional regulator, lower aerobic nicotinate degradation pathway regulator